MLNAYCIVTTNACLSVNSKDLLHVIYNTVTVLPSLQHIELPSVCACNQITLCQNVRGFVLG